MALVGTDNNGLPRDPTDTTTQSPAAPSGDPWTPAELTQSQNWANNYYTSHQIPTSWGTPDDLANNYLAQRRAGVDHQAAENAVPGLLGWDKYNAPATVASTTGATGAQDFSSGPWDANRVKAYFASRGVSPNDSSPDYWAAKWNEWGSKDPNYFMQRLSTADEFNPGGRPSAGAPPVSSGGFGGYGNVGSSLSTTSGYQANVPDPSAPYSHYQDSPKDSQLYNILMSRANQSLNVDPNDPIIKGQVEAYRATQDRGVRDYLAHKAESAGPYSNQDVDTRSAYEKAGQNTAGLQSQLMQNELTARRSEIQQALSESGSLLSQQDQIALQRELGLITDQLSKEQMGKNYSLGLGGLDLGQQQLNSNNDQFAQRFGLDTTNQANYWDSIRKGLI